MGNETEPIQLGEPSADERTRRLEAALHAQLDGIAKRYEDKVLEGITGLIARYDVPDASNVPDIRSATGEPVAQLSRPWDASPARMRLPEEERRLRTADGDFWSVQWLRAFRDKDFAGRVQADAKLAMIYPDLYRADTLIGTASGSGGFSGGTGGVLLPRPLEELVAIAISKIAKMARWATTYTMTAKEHNIPTAGAATAYMQAEATSPLTGGEPALAQVPLIAHEMIGKLVLGKTFLEDEATNVIPVFVRLMGDAMAELEDAQFLRTGNGSAPNVTKLAGTAFAETTSGILDASSVFRMYRTLPQRYRENAIWLAAPDVLGFLSGVRDGMGRPFWNSLLDPPHYIGDEMVQQASLQGAVGFLMGKPVHEVDLTAGDIYFGDVRRNYAIGRRRGITVETSDQFLFDTRRMMILVSQRIAGNNIDNSAGLLCSGITSATSL